MIILKDRELKGVDLDDILFRLAAFIFHPGGVVVSTGGDIRCGGSGVGQHNGGRAELSLREILRIVQLHQVQGEGDDGLLAFCDGGLQGIETRRNVFAVYGNLQRIRVENELGIHAVLKGQEIGAAVEGTVVGEGRYLGGIHLSRLQVIGQVLRYVGGQNEVHLITGSYGVGIHQLLAGLNLLLQAGVAGFGAGII